MEDFERIVNSNHDRKVMEDINFKRVVKEREEKRRDFETKKSKKRKQLALALAGIAATTTVSATVFNIGKDWQNNTDYCNLTGQETTNIFEYFQNGPKTKTVYVVLEGETYTFGNKDMGIELYSAAVLNEHETSGVDKKEDFIKENYEDYLGYVKEQLESGEKISGEDYIEYIMDQNSKGAR